MSGIGEFLREIMPAWLNRPTKEPVGLRSSGRYARMQGRDEVRALAREADDVWNRHVAAGLHCEAFPDAIAGPARKRDESDDKPEKSSGSNGLH